MKKPDEIKKDIIDCMEEAIAVGQTCDAQDLLDFSDKAYVCMATTRAYIQQLEAANAEKDKRIGELEQERDAAVCALHGDCGRCMFQQTVKCDSCRYGVNPFYEHDCWEWEGVIPDTEVQGDDH